MLNVNVLAVVGIAVFAVLSVTPVAAPLISTLMNSMQFMPHPY